MTATLSDAPVAERIANELIPEHHGHLANIRVRYLFSDAKAPKKLTCKVFAAATILTPLHRFLSSGGGDQEEGDHVAIVANEELWAQLTEEQRRAVIDHALSHLWIDDKDQLVSLEHDVGEFAGVIRRHGIWLDSMRPAAEAIKQARLLGFGDELRGFADDARAAAERIIAKGGSITVGA